MEIDLSKFTTEEIDAMFSAEKLRRRAEAMAKLEAVASECGFKLSDLMYDKGGMLKRSNGGVDDIIRQCISEGKTIEETGEALGWKTINSLYGRAKRLGLKFPHAK